MAIYPRLDQVQRPALVTNPGAAWHEAKYRKAVRAAKAHAFWPAWRHYYDGKRAAHGESADASRRLGMNPLTKRESRQLRDALETWRRAQFQAGVEHTKTGRVDAARLASYYQGRGDQAGADLQTFGRAENPQRAFDPFDYGTPTAAKRARDVFWRELRTRGVRARRWTLPGQLEPWAGLGRPGRGIRTVYLVDWQENPRARASRATYCPEQVAPKGRFDRRSFRTVVSDGHRVTVGCPKGKWDPRRQRCKVGTQAQRILHPEGEATCPLPGREVRRRRRRNPHMVIDAQGRVIASYGGHPVQTFRQAYARFRDDPAAAEILTSPRRLPVGARVSPVGRALMGGIPGVTKRNPPARAVELYRRVEFIGATKGPGGRHAGERFLHKFKAPARILGLPDGSLLIQPSAGR